MYVGDGDVTTKPAVEELRTRMLRHMDWRSRDERVALTWRGYLTGLYEWGLISVDDYGQLIDLLPKIGIREIDEIFAGEPLSPDREDEIARFQRGE